MLQDARVGVEQRRPAPQFKQPLVGLVIDLVQLVEGFDQERPAAARGVEDADFGEFVLPHFPELNQGLSFIQLPFFVSNNRLLLGGLFDLLKS